MSQSTPPGKGFFGWLGRQAAHVKKAVDTDVQGPKTIYRNNLVEETHLPDRPGVKLRRTTIDEVIVDSRKALEARGGGTVVGGTVVGGTIVDDTVIAGTIVDGTIVAGVAAGRLMRAKWAPGTRAISRLRERQTTIVSDKFVLFLSPVEGSLLKRSRTRYARSLVLVGIIRRSPLPRTASI